MSTKSDSLKVKLTENFSEFSQLSDYSFMNSLKADPQSTKDGNDHKPRSVYSGHYGPVAPTAIPEPEYISHSNKLFTELGLSSDLTKDQSFCRFFSGDISVADYPMSPVGWATGYALSIYGTEYTQQCPFGTGNGYGDGRAISIFEGLFNGKRMEMQLKGGGPTPYCRGADGRAVLRSSVREFLAQELMDSLGIPTSRSLTLYVSRSEIVRRPWYSKGSRYFEPDIMIENQAAITTRVAPSFLRVGQLELFARRVRNNAHDEALNELKMIVQHLIDRNYEDEIEYDISIESKVIKLACLYRSRLISLIANWMRVGIARVISIVIIVLPEVIPWIMAPLDSVNYLIQDFNHGQVEGNIFHFLILFISKVVFDCSTSFGKYFAASSKLFDIKIKGEQAIFVKTFLNFKNCFCIGFLITINEFIC